MNYQLTEENGPSSFRHEPDKRLPYIPTYCDESLVYSEQEEAIEAYIPPASPVDSSLVNLEITCITIRPRRKGTGSVSSSSGTSVTSTTSLSFNGDDMSSQLSPTNGMMFRSCSDISLSDDSFGVPAMITPVEESPINEDEEDLCGLQFLDIEDYDKDNYAEEKKCETVTEAAMTTELRKSRSGDDGYDGDVDSSYLTRNFLVSYSLRHLSSLDPTQLIWA